MAVDMKHLTAMYRRVRVTLMAKGCAASPFGDIAAPAVGLRGGQT
jgi:hypothetical protein